MTWLASNWMENLMPSSEEKEPIGERVPEVSTILRTDSLRSEKAFQQKQTNVFTTSILHYTTFSIQVNGSDINGTYHSRIKAPKTKCVNQGFCAGILPTPTRPGKKTLLI